MEPEICSQGFQAITQEEQQQINGGIWPIITGLAIVVVTQIVRDWDNFKNGLMGRPEE